MKFLTDNNFVRNLTDSVSQFMHQLVQSKLQQQSESSKNDLHSSSASALSEADSWGSPSSANGQETLFFKNTVVCSSAEWEYDAAILPEIHKSRDKEEESFNHAFNECFESNEPDWDIRLDQFRKTYAKKQ